MITTNASGAPHSDLMRFAWSGLRRFHHVPSVAEIIIAAHSVPAKHRNNVNKQADQIRKCLIQAREYRDAASLTSLATKPVLLYYSIMSLALAQILFKGSGQDSLDAARSEHSHHGLIFSAGSPSKGAYQLSETAQHLTARPMIVDGARRGTFELWHRTAREDPFVGKLTTYAGGGSTTRHTQALLTGSDERLGYLDPNGISLLDCFKGCPGLCHWLHSMGTNTGIVRGSAACNIIEDGREQIEILIHPAHPELIDSLQERFKFKAEDYEKVFVREFQSGFSLSVTQFPNDRIYMNVPAAAAWTNEELRFFPTGNVLNEFGYLYLGLYMLGNYARYYPDRWMEDVDSGSPIALTAEEFLSMAEHRMALLTLSDLSQTYFVQQV